MVINNIHSNIHSHMHTLVSIQTRYFVRELCERGRGGRRERETERDSERERERERERELFTPACKYARIFLSTDNKQYILLLELCLK